MKTVSERFWSKVEKTDDCWIWKAAKHPHGYGLFSFRPLHKWAVVASRVSWELTYGPIPTGMWVLHRCDNPPCVRPDHLFLGNSLDNNQDRHRKGRTNMMVAVLKAAALQKAKTHCKRNHEYTPENTRIRRGRRECRMCELLLQRERLLSRRMPNSPTLT